jgi:hypothetical protein
MTDPGEIGFAEKVEMVTKVLGPRGECEGTRAALWRYAVTLRVFRTGQAPWEIAQRQAAERKVDWRYQLERAGVPSRTRTDLDGVSDSPARTLAQRWLGYGVDNPHYRTLLLHGVSGSGKSVAASGLLLPLEDEKESWRRAKYFSERDFTPLVGRLRDAGVRDQWRGLENVRLLVIDNVGETGWSGAKFFQAVAALITLRCDRNLRTALVSRLDEQHFRETFDDKLARLVFDVGANWWLGQPYVGL